MITWINLVKDKTRTEAINDVKKEYKKFVETEDPQHSELASKVIFKELNKWLKMRKK